MRIPLVSITLVTLLLSACNSSQSSGGGDNPGPVKEATPGINYAVVTTYPHDTSSFTEGFLVHDGRVYESTGSPEELPQTKSLFGEVDLHTGKIGVKVELDKKKYFGEGIVFFKNKIYQLTYQTKVGFIYDAGTFKKLNEFTFPGKEGWGLTADSTSLIMSDGSSNLYYFDPVTFNTVKTLSVTDENGPVEKINELEYIRGFIYANVYTTNYIIKIDPVSGKVLGRMDLVSLVNEQKNTFQGALEMNGIAYNPVNDKVYITGKMWPAIYEIQFSH